MTNNSGNRITRTSSSLLPSLPTTILSVLAILAVVFISTFSISSLFSGCSPKVAKAAPQEMAEQTQQIVSAVKQHDVDVFTEIQRNVDEVIALRQRIETAPDSQREAIAADVIATLSRVADSYDNLSSKRDEIRSSIMYKADLISELRQRAQSEITDLQSTRNRYLNDISTFVSQDDDVTRTRKDALNQAAVYIDMQIRLWTEFRDTEQRIHEETLMVQKRVDSFLSIIDSTAILFREGINLLKLQQDITDALSLITHDMPAMERLSREMEQSWSHLDVLVNTLTSMRIGD